MFSIQKQAGSFCARRKQQTLSQKTKTNIYQGTKDVHGCFQRGEIFLSLLVKMFNGVRCLSGLLVEILCFPVRTTNETVFLSVKHTMKSTSWSAENANTCLSLCWLCVSRRSFLFLTIMVWGPGFVLVFIPWGKKWSSCLSSFCVASEPAFVSLEGIPGLLNKSIPSLAEWYGMCHQGNKLWGFTALPVWWLLSLYA